MLRNLAVTPPWAEGVLSRPLPLACGVKFETSKSAETAVNAINAVILVRRMMVEISGWVAILVFGEKILQRAFRRMKSPSSFGCRKHFFIWRGLSNTRLFR